MEVVPVLQVTVNDVYRVNGGDVTVSVEPELGPGRPPPRQHSTVVCRQIDLSETSVETNHKYTSTQVHKQGQ